MKAIFYTIPVLAGILGGCQSTNLYTESGTGTVIFPFEIESEARFPCRKIGFELHKRNTETDEKIPYGYHEFFISNGDTIGQVDALEPGVYEFNEFQCYARPGRIFSSGRYFSTPTFVKFTVIEEKFSLSKFSLKGSANYDTSGNSSFRVSFIYSTKDVNQHTYESLQNMELPAGWTVANP